MYPLAVDARTTTKEVPLDLARAGEARHFIAWRGAVAGLGGGKLGDLAVAAEAVLTDILLSAPEGTLRIESEYDEGALVVKLEHPEIESRRMAGLEGLLEEFLDDHEVSSTRAVLTKRISR
jgi:hypothetical protein